MKGMNYALKKWPMVWSGVDFNNMFTQSCWLHRFGLFLADELGKKFGQQFFSGPRYIVNFQLPAVGLTSKKHTITHISETLFTLTIYACVFPH